MYVTVGWKHAQYIRLLLLLLNDFVFFSLIFNIFALLSHFFLSPLFESNIYNNNDADITFIFNFWHAFFGHAQIKLSVTICELFAIRQHILSCDRINGEFPFHREVKLNNCRLIQTHQFVCIEISFEYLINQMLK